MDTTTASSASTTCDTAPTETNNKTACHEDLLTEQDHSSSVTDSTTHPQHLERTKGDTPILKRHLKQRKRIRKFQVRYQQAVLRRDTPVAQRATQELSDYIEALQSESTSVWYAEEYFRSMTLQELLEAKSFEILTSQDTAEASIALINDARAFITQHFWHPLLDQIMDTTTSTTSQNNQNRPKKKRLPTKSNKQNQTHQARQLLFHMTKGTQTESMFDNDSALLGYTRHKFMERALLAVQSLQRITSEPLLARLRNVRTVWSIGCGPGCDAVGVLTFLRHLQQPSTSNSNATPILDQILFMDYVMPQWNRLVLDSLVPLLSPEFVSSVQTSACDVRYSLEDPTNQDAKDCLEDAPPVDLIVVSYLLTETRGQWTAFFQSIMTRLKGQPRPCLFLMSEPTAWQLHLFQSQFFGSTTVVCDYQWLDSSRDDVSLQSLEGRMGPAVIMLSTS
eukprot:Nitzschia sp. Nitz4//scaffold15_size197535//131005//132354//NITZ4_001592-RA/size197535-processed-gene-0.25-mRNA-1//1//CDS//3329537757//3493//frame0